MSMIPVYLSKASIPGGLRRTAFSIIEVLASIAVILVGMLGVMILVPYAVQMSSTGLNIDAAIAAARNSYDQFVIEGYRDDANWLIQDSNGLPVLARQLWVNQNPATPLSIDPMAITRHPDNVPNYSINETGFPFNPDPRFPFDYRILPANLVQRDPAQADPDIFVPFDRAAADRLCQAGDDLVFLAAPESSPEGGPLQEFDRLQGSPLKRQSEGQFSWSALAFPQPNASPHSYRIYFLIYKNRGFDLNDPSIWMRFSPVLQPTVTVPVGFPVPPVSTINLRRPIDETAVRKDDWVMLINKRKPGVTAFDWQVAFCRVISASGNFLTVDGPVFDFNPNTHTDTYAVHLKDVVMVYDRTIVNEGQSSWNLKLF